jgi:hypothetical protein
MPHRDNTTRPEFATFANLKDTRDCQAQRGSHKTHQIVGAIAGWKIRGYAF